MFAAVIGLIVAAAPFDLTAHIEARQSQTVLEELYWRVATPHDLEYAQFRSPDDLAQLVGGTDEAVAEASAWLLGLNGKNIRVSGLRDTITATFSGAEPALFSKEWSENGLPAREGQPSGVAFVIRRDVKPASIGPTTLPPRFRTNALASRSRGAYSVSNQKTAYKIPADTAATNPKTMQMVWGPGTFGYSPDGLAEFKQEECPGINLDKVKFDTSAHGQPGGDNFGEGTLDTHMISSFGMNATTIVSNTNTSSSTEEGEGFGLAFLEMSGSKNRVSLEAYHAQPVTTSAALHLDVHKEYASANHFRVHPDSASHVSKAGFGVPEFGNATLRVAFAGTCRVEASDPPCKFKIIAVTSC